MKNEKTLYQLLNETKTDFWQYEEITVSGIEKQKLVDQVLKRQKPIQKNNRPVIVLVATIFLIFAASQTSWGQSVQAAATSFLENIQYSLAQVFGVDTSDTPDAAVAVEQTSSIGDAEVKLEDLLVFDDHILLHVLVDLKENMDEQRMTSFSEITVYMNGELLHKGGVPSSGSMVDEANNVSQDLIRIQLDEDFVLPETVQLDIQLKDVGLYRPGYTGTVPLYLEGAVNFSVETTVEALNKYTKVYSLDEQVSVGELDYHVNQLTLHPIVSYLSLHSPDREQDYQVMEFRGVNEAGKAIVFKPQSYRVTEKEWSGKMIFSEELSEITTQELNESEWIELQLHSAGHPNGQAHYQAYGEPFVIQLQK